MGRKQILMGSMLTSAVVLVFMALAGTIVAACSASSGEKPAVT